MADALKETGAPVRSYQDADERLQSKIVDYDNPANGATVDSDQDLHVKAKLRDDSGAAFGTEANPVFVTSTDNPNAEIHDYDKAVATASDASTTHTYSPAGNAKIKQLHLSASGLAKFEVAFGTTTSEVETYVYFNSVQEPSRVVNFEAPITLAATDSIVITKTNLENKAQDIYSTINGDVTA
jgi:hypothetical protein